MPIYTKEGKTRRVRREATLELRWCRVTLAPPKNDRFVSQDPLPVVAIELYERKKPKGAKKKFVSRLLVLGPVRDRREVLRAVGWYGDRWGIEGRNDMVKNALELEALPLADLAACKRALALAGPAAVQAARWVALSREPPPPKVEEVFDPKTLRELEQYAEYMKVKVAGKWTVREVVRVLGKLGGGDVRPERPAGWRVVLRGWQRFEEFRGLKNFLFRKKPRKPRKTRASKRSPKE